MAKDQTRYCFACGETLHPTKPHECPHSIHGVIIENDVPIEENPWTKFVQAGEILIANIVPIGIEPERIWKLRRRHALAETMNRYIDQGCEIPVPWLEEYNKLNKEIDESWG